MKALDEVVAVQVTHGNWNYDAYMHGMANGLILAQAIVNGTEPAFLKAPKDGWLADREWKVVYDGELEEATV